MKKEVKEVKKITKLFQDTSENSFSYTACNRRHNKTQTTYRGKYSKSVIYHIKFLGSWLRYIR
jgi:hypothetical protein